MAEEIFTKTFSKTNVDIPGSFPFHFDTLTGETPERSWQFEQKDQYCIARITQGEGEMRILTPPVIALTVKVGTVLLLSPGCVWSLIPINETDQQQTKGALICERMQFSNASLVSKLRDQADIQCIEPMGDPANPWYGFAERQTAADRIICEAAGTIFLEKEHPSLYSSIRIRGELLRLMASMLEQNRAMKLKHQPMHQTSQAIQTVKDYIGQHYAEPLKVADLAALCYFSETYMMNAFHAQTGITLMDYVTQIRIREACQLLLNSTQSVADIAYSCGFRNLSNFNRCFKKVLGMTPTVFRHGRKGNVSDVR